jgi:hypothetical protein
LHKSGSGALLGIWKLVSWQIIGENDEPQDVVSSNPEGYLILTPKRRSMALPTGENRVGGRPYSLPLTRRVVAAQHISGR